jgi:hypothetical protein
MPAAGDKQWQRERWDGMVHPRQSQEIRRSKRRRSGLGDDPPAAGGWSWFEPWDWTGRIAGFGVWIWMSWITVRYFQEFNHESNRELIKGKGRSCWDGLLHS